MVFVEILVDFICQGHWDLIGQKGFSVIADEGAAAADETVKAKIADVVMDFSPGSAGVDKTEVAVGLQFADGLNGAVRNVAFFAFGQDGAVNIKKKKFTHNGFIPFLLSNQLISLYQYNGMKRIMQEIDFYSEKGRQDYQNG